MHDPSVEGILHTSSTEEMRSILHHQDLCMTSEDRIKLLWQAFCAAISPKQRTVTWCHVRYISIVLLEELLLTGDDPDQLGISCGRAMLLQDADPEGFTCLLQYASQYQTSSAVRAVVCWGLSTLPINMHKFLWETILVHLPQICLTCPLLLVWYWLLHCYEYNKAMGNLFLQSLDLLADSGKIDAVDYCLLKSLTYTALLAGQPSFPFNSYIRIVNLSKEVLFQSDGEFILQIASKSILTALMQYPDGIFYYLSFLNKFKYIKNSTNLCLLLSYGSTGIGDSEDKDPLKCTVNHPLISSVLALIRQIVEVYTDPYSLSTSDCIEVALREAAFFPEHIDSALVALKAIDLLPANYNTSSLTFNNKFWINPLCKPLWKTLDDVHQYHNLIKLLVSLMNQRMEWKHLKPWLSLFASVAGSLLFGKLQAQSDDYNTSHREVNLIDMLGAFHPALPIASLVCATSQISTKSIAPLVTGLQTLISCGWISIFLKEESFSRASGSTLDAADERMFIANTLCSLLFPVFSYPMSYMGSEMQLFDSLMVQRLLKAIILQVQWSGTNKNVIELIKVAIANEWLTVSQWKDITTHAYQVLRAGANFWSLKSVPLLESIVQIGLFISDLYPSKRKETINDVLDQIVIWYGEFHSSETNVATFIAIEIKRCLAKIESSEEKADTCLRILSHVKELNDITFAVIDVILNSEKDITTSTRDRLALALEKYKI
ncbi:Hypothetical protein GLP15_1011 [Giardia lamblia P15]|uniref:Uncharacterized protein n=1 Tax=Giardia intestinalis (strain P15) TaxID=658858 RepID=E1F321_GIAIA|nr:Hypothetical protein GLP15_1011 [Giardia lamblia P15]